MENCWHVIVQICFAQHFFHSNIFYLIDRSVLSKVSELEMVKSGIQGLKAEKIVLEEKVGSLTRDLQACKKEIGKYFETTLRYCLKFSFKNIKKKILLKLFIH